MKIYFLTEERQLLRLLGPALIATFTVALGACGASETNYAPDFRPGTSIVWVGQRWEGFSVSSTNLDDATVQDVHHDMYGDIVTVRVRWSGVATYHPVAGCVDCVPTIGSAGAGLEGLFFTSNDGATWRDLTFESGWASGLPMGIYRSNNGAHAVAIGASSHRGVGGSYYPDWFAQRVDLRGPALIPDAGFDGVAIYDPRVVPGDQVAGIYRDSRDNTMGASVTTTIDAWTLPMTGPERDLGQTPFGVFRTADGEVFTAYSDLVERYLDGAHKMELCRVDMRLDGDHLPVVTCRGLASFPPPFSDYRSVTHVARDRVVRLASDGRRTWAITIDPGLDRPAIFDLGPGDLPPQVHNSWRYDLRQRYGWLIRLQRADGSARFVDLSPDGTLQDVPLPMSPCRNDCAAELVWASPLGGDAWRLFYAVSDLSAAHAPMIVARDATVAPIAPDMTPAGPATSPLPGYPNAVPAGGLERACLAMSSCHLTLRYDTCLMNWSGMAGPGAERFVTAADKGCAALDEAWAAPSLVGTPCPPLQSWCVGNVMVTGCSGGHVGFITEAEDCGIHGTTCTTTGMGSGRAACADTSTPANQLACDSCTPAGNSVRCVTGNGQWFPLVEDCGRRGAHCRQIPSAICVPDGPCPNGLAACEGDLLVSCGAGQERVETYCPDWGDTCHVDAGGRVLGCEAQEELECITQTFRMGCVGSVAAFCTASRNVHYVDCQALGFGGCQDDSGVPICTP